MTQDYQGHPPHIPEGAFSYPLERVYPTRWFGFLLLHKFTLLAFCSAVEPLRIANQLAQQPLYGWITLSETGAPVASSSGIEIGVQDRMDIVAPDLQLFLCSGTNGLRAASDKVLSAVRRHARFGGKLGGICTGAATLARAGVLNGKRFTLHWENQPGFVEAFPDLTPSRARFEEDGHIITCSGGSAATEMMLQVIAQDYGDDFAIAVADMCLNDPNMSPQREQRSSIARAIDSRNPKLLHVLRGMYAHVEDPITLEQLAEDAGLSRRHMERLFKSILNEAPATTYRNIKLDRARALLSETDMTVTEVAFATGFNAANVFSKHYKARFGETPYGKRGTTP